MSLKLESILNLDCLGSLFFPFHDVVFVSCDGSIGTSNYERSSGPGGFVLARTR